MPSFFNFQTGNERPWSRGESNDTSPLLGRFRAVPATQPRRRRSVGDLISGNWRNSIPGYGTIFGEDNADGVEGEGGLNGVWGWRKRFRDVWIEPTQAGVRGVLERWWWRWAVLVGLPAALAVIWCAIPFPQYPLEDDDEWYDQNTLARILRQGHRIPGHGEARVQVNFWFFLFVYYGFYNITALLWVTKVFNIYSLNWWPQSLGFPLTISLITATSLLVPIPIYYNETTRALATNNTVWILWTFITMAMPVAVAFAILMNHERHLSLRQPLSETQRIFTTSWFIAEGDYPSINGRRNQERRQHISTAGWDPNAPLDAPSNQQTSTRGARLTERRRWLPASFIRFIWFCLALSVGLLAYVLGEVYSESYLRTLPHSNVDTIFYVYSWVVTIHLLDGLTGFILGGDVGERVGSYPLGWVFKLYFMLTYQTYVRALYARLRSPSQFLTLQAISSSFLIILSPLTMSTTFHSLLSLLHINNQPYNTYKKYCGRNIFIRGIAENVSMIAFLGEVVVLHFGANKDVYPYFSFQDPLEDYTFRLTFYFSCVTWACEIIAGWLVRRIVAYVYKFNVTAEGKMDLASWPELLPTSLAVMVHVLQNMMFSIVRLKFF